MEENRTENLEASEMNTLQTDMTEWLYRIMVGELQDLLERDKSVLEEKDHAVESKASRSFIHYLYGSHLKYFGGAAKYDIKLKMKTLFKGAVALCGNQKCVWVDYSTPGNILFGYISAGRGINQKISWAAGGLLESLDTGKINWEFLDSWFDNPDDKAAVDFGYHLFEKYGLDLSWETFQSELTPTVLDSFQKPVVMPDVEPQPQKNVYPYNHFFQ